MSPVYSKAADSLPPIPEGMGRLYVYDPGMLATYNLRYPPIEVELNGKRICSLYSGVFYYQNLAPGRYVIRTMDPESGSTAFQLYSGETKYLAQQIHPGEQTPWPELVSSKEAQAEMKPTQEFQNPTADAELQAHIDSKSSHFGAFVSYADVYPVAPGAGVEWDSKRNIGALQLGYSQIGRSWGAMLWAIFRTPSILYLEYGTGVGWVQYYAGDINIAPYQQTDQGIATRVRIGGGWQISRNVYVETGVKSVGLLYPLLEWKGAFAQMGYRF